MTEETYKTRDEAIAAGLAESRPGDVLSIHSEACSSCLASSNEQAEALCSCEPLVLVIGSCA